MSPTRPSRVGATPVPLWLLLFATLQTTRVGILLTPIQRTGQTPLIKLIRQTQSMKQTPLLTLHQLPLKIKSLEKILLLQYFLLLLELVLSF